MEKLVKVMAAIDAAEQWLRQGGIEDAQITINLNRADFTQLYSATRSRLAADGLTLAEHGNSINRMTYKGRHVIRTGFSRGVTRTKNRQ